MKVTINGSCVTPGSIHAVLADLEKEYGLKIRDLTMYIRFVDENGHGVEPKLPANGNELVMTIRKPDEDARIGHQELLEMVERAFGSKIHGEGLRMVVSWVEFYKLTKREAAEALKEIDQTTTLRTIDRRVQKIFKKREQGQ